MKPARRRFLHLAAGAVALPALSGIASAQTYPVRPVRLVVAFVAGGATDTLARLISNDLGQVLGQNIVVENRPGANGYLAWNHVATAEPVGSVALTQKYNLGVSSATIRNEMAELEAGGYLVQPHTSAGRVPSDAGYRTYVDRLMPPEQLTKDDTRRIRDQFREASRELGDVIHEEALAGVSGDDGQRLLQTLEAMKANLTEACEAAIAGQKRASDG